MARKDTLSRFRQRRQNCFWLEASTRESRAHMFAKTVETLLLWQKNEAVPQTQYGKGCTRSQAKVLPETLWDRELSLLADLRSCQIFERGLPACHMSVLLVGISYNNLISIAGSGLSGALPYPYILRSLLRA